MNYSYAIDVGAGPFGNHTVRVQIIGSACNATNVEDDDWGYHIGEFKTLE